MPTIAPITPAGCNTVGPKMTLLPEGRGVFLVEMDAATFAKLQPEAGEWLEASKFFDDDGAGGSAVTVKGPFSQKKCTRSDGWELMVRFKIHRHAG